MDGQGRQLPIQVLADQLILIQPEKADCPPPIVLPRYVASYAPDSTLE